jgi:uncharacterized metal-binding protein YceD (DUF177 family)
MSGGETAAAGHEFKRFLSVRKVGDSGLEHKVEASAAECVRIAAFLDVVSVTSLRAVFRVNRWRARGIRLEGHLAADVVQSCVVTLEPVENHVDARFERRYLPAEMIEPEQAADDILVDPDGEDPPEPLTHEIDLGGVVVEELALNVDPYPRKPGSVFAPSAADDGATAPASPFAALARLKGRPGPGKT